MAKSLIIIPNQEISGLEIYRKSSNSKSHSTLLEEFIYATDLNINTANKTGYEVSSEIASLGHIPILVEGNFMLTFIPESITKEQYRWFREAYNVVNRFKLSYYKIIGESLIPIEQDLFEETPIIKSFYNELKKRVKHDKMKIKS